MGAQRHNIIPINASFCLLVRYTTNKWNKSVKINFFEISITKILPDFDFFKKLVKCLYMVQTGNQTYKNLFKKLQVFIFNNFLPNLGKSF
jgi:hypothetical protein